MGMTYKQMQDDVLDLCQELQGRTDFTLKRVKRLINIGYKNFCKDTDALTSLFSITTVANQDTYSSSDLANWAFVYRVLSVKYVEETSEFGKELLPYPGGYAKLPRNKSYGEPDYYYLQDIGATTLRKIGTYPIIAASSETLEIQACHYPLTDLSADTDEPSIEDEYRSAIVYYAAARAMVIYAHSNPAWRTKATDMMSLYRSEIETFNLHKADGWGDSIKVTDVTRLGDDLVY